MALIRRRSAGTDVASADAQPVQDFLSTPDFLPTPDYLPTQDYAAPQGAGTDGAAPLGSEAPAGDSRRGRVPSLAEVLDASITVPSGLVRRQVDALRVKHPNASPEKIIQMLERRYLLAVTSTGGAVGAAAAFPSVGTGTAIALTTSQVGTFLAASAVLALAVADVHGVEIDDVPRRRTLVLASLLGEEGSVIVENEVGVGTLFWARSALTRLPLATVKTVNASLARRAAKYGATRGGAFFLGRLAPFGIGAAIGVAGARAMGGTMINGVRRAFGPPPESFARAAEVGAVVLPAGAPGSPAIQGDRGGVVHTAGTPGPLAQPGAVVVPDRGRKARRERRAAERAGTPPPEHVDVPRI